MTTTHTRAAAAFLLLAPLAAISGDIAVSGLFAGKAIIQLDGGRPRMLTAGQVSPEGVRLISASSESAVIEYQGRRETLRAGEGTRLGAAAGDSSAERTVLTADAQGHFVVTGAANGQTVRFLLDTGASAVVMSAGEARRIGVNYLGAPRSPVQTANGVIGAWRVKLDTVRVGAIVAHNVDAVVTEGELPVVLLGMSFLNRTEMKRDGDTMTLTRRY